MSKLFDLMLKIFDLHWNFRPYTTITILLYLYVWKGNKSQEESMRERKKGKWESFNIANKEFTLCVKCWSWKTIQLIIATHIFVLILVYLHCSKLEVKFGTLFLAIGIISYHSFSYSYHSFSYSTHSPNILLATREMGLGLCFTPLH